MKKLLLLAAGALAIGTVQARTLTPGEALARVTGGNGAARVQTLASPKLVATGNYQGLTTYYVYSGDNNALIVSASDITAPVIGYLDHPVTENTQMPPQLVNWLGKFGKALKNVENNAPAKLSKNGTKTLTPVNVAGITVQQPGMVSVDPKTARSNIAPLIKTTWDQGAPYNNLCPTGTYTGCVATAMAQAMKYHNYPDVGVGYVSTTYNKQTLNMNLANTPFAWDSMLDTYTTKAPGTDEQRTAVATLMKAAGYSVKMQYGTSASGALSLAMPNAFVNNFNYDKGTQIVTRCYYTDDQWVEMIYNELAAARPVVYSGSGDGGGHEFICDGFNATNNYFHFNWGWSGAYDGYFSINNMVPEGQGAGGNNGGFNDGQDALIGLQKPTTGTTKQTGFIGMNNGNLQASASGRKVTVSSSDGIFINASSFTASFDIGFTLKNVSSGSVNTSIIYQSQSIQPGYGFSSVDCTIPATVADGEYQIYLSYRLAGETTWKPVRLPLSSPEYVTLNISGNTIEVTNHGTDPEPPVTEDWDFDENLKLSAIPLEAGTEFTLYATVTNNTSEEGTKNLVAMIVNTSYTILNRDYADFIVPVTLKAGETADLELSGNVPTNIAAGDYIVCVADVDQMALLIGGKVPITSDYISFDNLSFTSIAVTPNPIIAGEAITVKTKYKNTGDALTDFQIDMLLCQEDPDDEESLIIAGECGSVTTTFKKVGIASAFNTTGTCPANIPAGSYYFVLAHDNTIIGYAEVTVENNAGVEDITIDVNSGDAKYFDLQGRPVNSTTLAPGIYIRRDGAKADKVLVK